MSRLEALDLVIRVLQEHERELSRIAFRLERIAERLETLERGRRRNSSRRRRT